MPFALQSQYVPAILAARTEAGEPHDDDDDADDEKDVGKIVPPKESKSKLEKTQKRKNPPQCADSADVEPQKTEWQYGTIRKAYIQARREEGCSFDEAVCLWDDSMEKARYLAPCSVGELKKRRFLEKGSTENPWYKKIHGPAN